MHQNILKSIICTLVLFLALSGEDAYAQEVKLLNSDHLTRYDQLEGISLFSVHGDEAGNVWIASRNGLIRFDGYDFESLFHNPYDSTSIGQKFMITAFSEDKFGNLWIGSFNAVYKYAPKTNSFTTYDLTHFIDEKNLLGFDILTYDITSDSLGNVFFALVMARHEGGTPQTLVYFDAKDQKMKKLKSSNGIELKDVFRITTAPDNNVWALSLDGLFRIDEQLEIHELTNLHNDFINKHVNGGNETKPERIYTSLKCDESGLIWLTTNKAELYSFDPQNSTLELHPLPAKFAFDISSNGYQTVQQFWTILIDKERNLFIGTHNGVLKYDPLTKTSWIIEKDKMPEGRIFGFNEDVFGNIWIAGLGGILYKYNPQSPFKTLPLKDDPGFSKRLSNTSHFFEDKDGKVWQSAKGRPTLPSINQLDLSKGKITEYSFDTYFPGRSGVYLLGAIDNGKYLYKSNQGTGVFEKGIISPSPNIFDSIPPINGELHLVKDSRQSYWWCTQNGVYLQLKNELKLRHFDLTIFPDSRPWTNHVQTIYEGRNGNIWILTENGLFLYDYDTGEINRCLYDKEKGGMLYSQNINVLYEDHDQVLWIGTWQGGFSRYDLKTKRLKTYTTKDGLPSMQIMGILPDEKRGDLWLSSYRGITKFNIQEEQFTNFSNKDGLKDIIYDNHSCLKTSEGYLIFGAMDNITYFSPEDISRLSQAPKVSLTDLKIGDQSIRNMPELANHFVESTVQNLPLNYRQNSISFEYKAIHFDNPEFNQYAYKLDNYDNEWRKVGNNRKAFYNNLPAGKYSFLLKAGNSYGMWSQPKVFTNFTIHPPWWATWWAYGLYFLAGMALIYSVYRFQLKRNLDQAEASRLKELDAVKNRLYTNITHEFRTPLSVISGMTDQMEENPKEWFRDGLSMIRRNTNRLLELVNQMLDLTKLESGKTALHNQQGDIITYLKYIVESIHSFAESKKVQVHFHEEGGELMMDFDPEKIHQILINLLSNAVKFTPAEGHIYVHVRAVAEKDSPQKGSKLQIKVKNTGAGIPEDQLPYIFDRFYQVDDSTTRMGEGSGIGLALVKELVKLMKGDISVKSKVGKDTEFTLLLPISNIAPEGQTPAPIVKYKTTGLARVNQDNITTTTIKEELETMLNGSKPSVLLVEDNLDVVAYTASCLKGQYDIQVAKDGQEGIDIATENIPDLIITDVMMPYKDGFEVCQTLKIDQRTSHIPIIMLTAKADMESKIEGLEEGADAYLAKPFHKQELLIRIKKLLELRANLQKYYLAIAGSNAPESNEINTPETPAVENKFVLRLREVAEAHLEDFDFTVEQFCKEVAMSHSQLHRKMTALTGLSPNKFIRHVRLSKAKELLRASELTINAVAYETGFNDPGYFGRVFKKEFGVTPMEWKERRKT